ncbi:hypothetical protein J699_00053 [Acinetobacter sp. 1000160]|nr:hypothetical protein J522_1991 [Acinetobacter baumannii 146457]EYT23675.1 hypothetical protein J699_00053 [Acinetobacter sp. 1000160]
MIDFSFRKKQQIVYFLYIIMGLAEKYFAEKKCKTNTFL